MKNVSAMENEELVDEFESQGQKPFNSSQSPEWKEYATVRAELLHRLSAPVQPGTRPKPEDLFNGMNGETGGCCQCSAEWTTFALFCAVHSPFRAAAFFPVAAPSAPPVDADMLAALKGIRGLFANTSPFYIKKLGSPITNGDQERIDRAFIAIDAAIAKAEENQIRATTQGTPEGAK